MRRALVRPMWARLSGAMTWNRRVVGLLVAVLASSCQASDGDPAGELADRLTVEAEKLFGFSYRAAGTSVLDCALANRQFHVTVDREDGSVVLRRDSMAGDVMAIARPDRVLLHRSLFAKSPVPTEWLSLPGGSRSDVPEEIIAALGIDAASYAFSEGLPADGEETALSVLDAARTAGPLEPTRDDSQPVDAYRLRLSSEALADIEATETDRPGPVVVDVWVDDDDQVSRITVSDPATDTAGWSLEYTAPAMPIEVEPTAETGLDEIRGRLQPAPLDECTLGSTAADPPTG